MTHSTSNKTISKPFYAITGALLGALIALAFAGMDNMGIIGVGVVLGVTVGNDLYRRFNQRE